MLSYTAVWLVWQDRLVVPRVDPLHLNVPCACSASASTVANYTSRCSLLTLRMSKISSLHYFSHSHPRQAGSLPRGNWNN